MKSAFLAFTISARLNSSRLPSSESCTLRDLVVVINDPPEKRRVAICQPILSPYTPVSTQQCCFIACSIVDLLLLRSLWAPALTLVPSLRPLVRVPKCLELVQVQRCKKKKPSFTPSSDSHSLRLCARPRSAPSISNLHLEEPPHLLPLVGRQKYAMMIMATVDDPDKSQISLIKISKLFSKVAAQK